MSPYTAPLAFLGAVILSLIFVILTQHSRKAQACLASLLG